MLPPGAQGEIQLRGPNLLRGVCGRPRSELFTADGFYPTGDLGRLDADGTLWSAGRLDDMFKVKGATVYPAEVEQALRSIPGVAQAFVTNVPAADGTQEVAALVVSSADQESLTEAARARLSSFKVPALWLVVQELGALPLSPTGKIQKPALQHLLLAKGSRPKGDPRQ